jgi:hypothetical protein
MIKCTRTIVRVYHLYYLPAKCISKYTISPHSQFTCSRVNEFYVWYVITNNYKLQRNFSSILSFREE